MQNIISAGTQMILSFQSLSGECVTKQFEIKKEKKTIPIHRVSHLHRGHIVGSWHPTIIINFLYADTSHT